jgi:hypothetical protein
MSTNANKTYNFSVTAGVPGTDRLERWALGDLNAAPAVREMGYHTTEHRIVVNANGTQQRVAWQSDLLSFGRYRGGWDASTGIPTAAGSALLANDPIQPGDMWLVTTAGTITGMIGGDILQAGDMIKATAAAANTAAQFVGIEQNAAVLPVGYLDNIAVAALVADTAAPFTSATLTDIHNYDVRDTNGVSVKDRLVCQQTAPNVITLTSSTAQTNLTIRAIGAI